MKIVGIICEYNPFHKGHKKQFDIIRRTLGSDTVIVCLMSGNYVQRGAPAVFDKMVRAAAAIKSGADLVLELPLTASLSSAEGFAAKGVAILSPVCDYLCFGAETADADLIKETAQALLSDAFPAYLKEALSTGISFPAARQIALQKIGGNPNILLNPNDILAVEYSKAILQQKSGMEILPIRRNGNYHDITPDSENPSATALRRLITITQDWAQYTTPSAANIFQEATVHTLDAGQRAILAKLRTMSDDEFAALPYGSEGLWRKLMHAARKENTLADIINATKSKRYTRTRIDRMIMCAFLGITEKDLRSSVPYVRILGFNDRGRSILRTAKESCNFVNIGEELSDPYQNIEYRCSALYGLFAVSSPESPEADCKYRVIYDTNAKKDETV